MIVHYRRASIRHKSRPPAQPDRTLNPAHTCDELCIDRRSIDPNHRRVSRKRDRRSKITERTKTTGRVSKNVLVEISLREVKLRFFDLEKKLDFVVS